MINVCVVGLGGRGFGLLRGQLLTNKDIRVLSVCDLYEDRIARAVDFIRSAGGDALGFTDYKDALNVKGIDAVYIFSDWNTHSEIAIYAMKRE